jgi:hypothetical protein
VDGGGFGPWRASSGRCGRRSPALGILEATGGGRREQDGGHGRGGRQRCCGKEREIDLLAVLRSAVCGPQIFGLPFHRPMNTF